MPGSNADVEIVNTMPSQPPSSVPVLTEKNKNVQVRFTIQNTRIMCIHVHVLYISPYILLFKHFCFHVRNNTSQICVNSEVIVCGKKVSDFNLVFRNTALPIVTWIPTDDFYGK